MTAAEAPELCAIIERLARRADMPMPSVHVIPTDHANGFATGRRPNHAGVAVTQGTSWRRSTSASSRGVLAHELSHVRNYDVLVTTIATGIAGVISAIGYALQ